ncbi:MULTISPECIES: RHS repeat domain-containing protein [unclassified Treponema]|uniref:RHS repeat domain-containing protein n=1 Tax=unclassified Treponema TaxID=2638727 RepID=UPI0020A4B58E|nr:MULTISPECIES: RHS repeat-associated core domain-containing protein [unclassified Treponema]
MKVVVRCLLKEPNYLFRTAIAREQKQFIQIAFAVHLSAVISAERYRSESGALKNAVSVFVYFYIVLMVHKYRQSAKRKLLLNSPTDRTFENRWSRYKEPSKNKAEAYLVYVEHLFLRSDAGDARIFSKEEDVYGIDYGFGLDAPKETEQTNPQDLFAYRRNYTWNERNLLTKSSDRNYTVHYRYGEDGQRALKYTDEGRSETLYFNNFFTIHIPTQDQNNPQGLRVHKHIFVGNSRLVTAMTHTDNSGDNDEQKAKRYYYHSDHLGSAQFVTDWRGKQYEHIEYTPYGELWVEEVAAGLDKLPFRFTGKELDEETGLYYYGARYLDPKYSRWLSGDPALGEYIPQAPVNDEAKKHNENLPGMGGVYNTVNLHVYHYAGNNPVKYTDPDGKVLHVAIGALLGAAVSVASVAVNDWLTGNISSASTYIGAAVGGAASGAIIAGTGNGYIAGAVGSSIGDLTKQMIDNKGDITKIDVKELITVTAIGTATGALSNNSVPGITSGKGSMLAVSKQISTKLANGTIKNISTKTAAKIALARCTNCALVEGNAFALLLSKGVEKMENYLQIVDKQQNQSSILYITNGE